MRKKKRLAMRTPGKRRGLGFSQLQVESLEPRMLLAADVGYALPPSSTLWAEYERVAEATGNFAMRRASEREQIYPVFRDLFRKGVQ